MSVSPLGYRLVGTAGWTGRPRVAAGFHPHQLQNTNAHTTGHKRRTIASGEDMGAPRCGQAEKAPISANQVSHSCRSYASGSFFTLKSPPSNATPHARTPGRAQPSHSKPVLLLHDRPKPAEPIEIADLPPAPTAGHCSVWPKLHGFTPPGISKCRPHRPPPERPDRRSMPPRPPPPAMVTRPF